MTFFVEVIFHILLHQVNMAKNNQPNIKQHLQQT